MSTKGSIDKTPAARSEPEPSLLQRYGVGVDTHRDFIQVRVLRKDQSGEIEAHEEAFQTTWQGLLDAVAWTRAKAHEHDPDALRYCIESTGTYHCPVLLAWGGRPAVVNPVLASPTRRKTDVLDARLLARQSITAMWPESYVPPPALRNFRVLRLHQNVLRHAARTIAVRLNGWILRFGFTCGREVAPRSKRFLAILGDLANGRVPALPSCPPWPIPAIVQPALRAQLALLERLDADEREASKFTLAGLRAVEITTDDGEIVRGPALLELLQTVPGVGLETAIEWIAHVSDVRRFGLPQQCVAYCGCDPSLKVSAGKVTSHTRRKGNKTIAGALRIAATAALRSDSKLGRWGRSLHGRYKRGGWKRAVSAVARRIVIALFHVQRTGQKYDESKYVLPELPSVPCENLTAFALTPRHTMILESLGLTDTVLVTNALWTGRLNAVKGLGETCLVKLRQWIKDNRTVSAEPPCNPSESTAIPDSGSAAPSSRGRTGTSRGKTAGKRASSRTRSTRGTRST